LDRAIELRPTSCLPQVAKDKQAARNTQGQTLTHTQPALQSAYFRCFSPPAA
jgi:hypothetical protein